MFGYFMRWTRRPSPRGFKQWTVALMIVVSVFTLLYVVGRCSV